MRAQSLTRHVRFLRSFNGETSIARAAVREALGRDWAEDETVELQILLDRKKRSFYLAPRIVPKPARKRMNLSGAPGAVRCFCQPYDVLILRFNSVILRDELDIEAGTAYRVFVRKAAKLIYVPLRDPIRWSFD